MDARSFDNYCLQLEDYWSNLFADFRCSKVGYNILNLIVGFRMEYNQLDMLEMVQDLIFYSRIELKFSIVF
jgi:hypothetical protein